MSVVSVRDFVHRLYYNKWDPPPSRYTHITPHDVNRKEACRAREKNGSLSSNPIFNVNPSPTALDPYGEPQRARKVGRMTWKLEQNGAQFCRVLG